MKTIFMLITMFTTSLTFGQILVATTEDGRRVILNEDKTWAFIDKVIKEDSTNEKFPDCNLPADFIESEGNKKIKGWLKKVDATLDDLKDHVAVDNDCTTQQIKIVQASEQRGNGNYVLCVKGKEMRYRRTGSVFHRQGISPVGKF